MIAEIAESLMAQTQLMVEPVRYNPAGLWVFLLAQEKEHFQKASCRISLHTMPRQMTLIVSQNLHMLLKRPQKVFPSSQWQ